MEVTLSDIEVMYVTADGGPAGAKENSTARITTENIVHAWRLCLRMILRAWV
jgi:hypothetical protein